MESRWEHVSTILLGLAAVITAAVKGLPPLLRYLGARGREAADRRRREDDAAEERRAAKLALETRVLVALEASAAAIARSTEASERVIEALVEQGRALQRVVAGVERTAEATRVLLEDRRLHRRTGRTPLSGESEPCAPCEGEDAAADVPTLRLGEG